MQRLQRDMKRMPADGGKMRGDGSTMPGARPAAPGTPAAPGAARKLVPTGAAALGRASRQMGPVTSAPAQAPQAAPSALPPLPPRFVGEALMSQSGGPPPDNPVAGPLPGMGTVAGPASIAGANNGGPRGPGPSGALVESDAAAMADFIQGISGGNSAGADGLNNGGGRGPGPSGDLVASDSAAMADLIQGVSGGNSAGADGPAPVNLDELAGNVGGGLYEEIARLLGEGGRDVEGEQAALAAQMQADQQQQMVDARARMGAMGMGASGAQVALEGDLNQQAAIAQALASGDIAASARNEDLQKLGSLTKAFGGLEGLSQDQKMLDLAFSLLGEEDSAATGGDGGGILKDVVSVFQDMVPWGSQSVDGTLDLNGASITPDENGNGLEQFAAWLVRLGQR